MKRDYYNILEVSRDATSDEIKQAYRKLARKFHPDMVADNLKAESEEKFKDLSEAYEVLIDPSKRRMYNLLGKSGVENQFFNGNFDWSNFSHFGDLQEILGELLENIVTRYFGEVGKSIFNTLFDKVVSNKPNIDELVVCPVCKGSGITKVIGTKFTNIGKCHLCKGVGKISVEQKEEYEREE